jgi:hypothetical protein
MQLVRIALRSNQHYIFILIDKPIYEEPVNQGEHHGRIQRVGILREQQPLLIQPHNRYLNIFACKLS